MREREGDELWTEALGKFIEKYGAMNNRCRKNMVKRMKSEDIGGNVEVMMGK